CGLRQGTVDAVLVVLGPVEEREGGGGGAGGPVAVALCYVVEQSGHGGRGGLPVVGFFEEDEGEHPCLVLNFVHEVGDVEVDGCGVGFWCAWHSGVCVASGGVEGCAEAGPLVGDPGEVVAGGEPHLGGDDGHGRSPIAVL